MEISPLLQLPTTVTLTASTSSLPEIRNWQTGQLLEAIVTSQANNGQVKLQIGSILINARMQFSVEPGQKFILEVVKLTDPPTLQLAQTASNKDVIINAALRAVLPKQIPGLPPLLSNIAYISSQPAQSGTTIPPDILLLAKTFFNFLPKAKQISTPKGLQQAIKNSGIFLERKLADKASSSRAPDIDIQHDVKAGLLKLRQAIQAVSKEHTSPLQQTSTNTRNGEIQPTEKTATAKPVFGKPITESLFTDRPVAEKPVADKPVAKNSITEKPIVKKDSIEHLISRKSISEKQATEKSVDTKPVTEKISNKPVAEKSSTEVSFTKNNITKQSTTVNPTANHSIIDKLLAKIPLANKTPTHSLAPIHTNKNPVTNTDNPQTIKTDNSNTTDKNKLDLAKRVSNQIRNTTKAIRNALMRPDQTKAHQSLTSDTRSTPGSSSPLSSILSPGKISLSNLEAILKSINITEVLPYTQITKGLLQTQSRVTATINQQSLLDQIISILFKDVESSLARIQFHQLTSQPQDTDTKQAWIMELPARREDGTDVFHLHIEREKNNNGTDSANKFAWTIRLSFTLEELGHIHARISLAGEHVSTTFWLENQQTTTLFRKHLNELQDNLTRAGISIDQLKILNGSPPETEGALFPQPLLHEKA